MSELTVLMMGSPRCGKTSVLASVFSMMCAEPLSGYFNISDQTAPEIKGIELQDSLKTKTAEMRDFVTETGKKAGKNSFLIDATKTNYDWTYKLRIGKKNRNAENLTLKFIDIPGEWCSLSSPRHNEFQQYAENSQVYVIVVDTPYLMGPTDEATMDLCDDNISEATIMAGVINDLDSVFAKIQADDTKLVIFVPVKCEKWVKQGRFEAVSERIKEAYRTTISNLKARENISIAIIPMQTIGSIEFSEFHEAKYLNDPSNKCHLVPDDPKTIIMFDGTEIRKKLWDRVLDDPNYVITGSVLRPSSWYKAVGDEFKPYNCEQLPLHILRFMVKKIRALEYKTRVNWVEVVLSPTYALIKCLLEGLQKVFERIDIADLESKLNVLQDAGIVKDNCEGIEYLVDVFAKNEET